MFPPAKLTETKNEEVVDTEKDTVEVIKNLAKRKKGVRILVLDLGPDQLPPGKNTEDLTLTTKKKKRNINLKISDINPFLVNKY
jgi:hypothetical protein